MNPDDQSVVRNDANPAPVDPPEVEQAETNSAGVTSRQRVVSDSSGSVHSERSVHDIAGEQRIGLGKANQFVWLVAGIIEALIGLRIVLKLIAANPQNSFAAFIYGFSDIFVRPFATITRTPSAGGVTLDVPAIIALFVYVLLAWAIVKVLLVVWPTSSGSTTRSSSTYDRYR